MIGQTKRRGDLDQILSAPQGGEVLALLPRALGAPSLELPKAGLDGALGPDLERAPSSWQGVELNSP